MQKLEYYGKYLTMGRAMLSSETITAHLIENEAHRNPNFITASKSIHGLRGVRDSPNNNLKDQNMD